MNLETTSLLSEDTNKQALDRFSSNNVKWRNTSCKYNKKNCFDSYVHAPIGKNYRITVIFEFWFNNTIPSSLNNPHLIICNRTSIDLLMLLCYCKRQLVKHLMPVIMY